jgi:predicted RNA-binding Zn ribbon-like protein
MTHPEEFTDTDPRAMEVWLDLLRQKPPGERLATTLALTDLTLKVTEAGVRASHPQASDREVFLRLAARHLPRELMVRAYGWDPELDGNAR